MRLELVHLLIIFIEVLSLLVLVVLGGGDARSLMRQRLFSIPVPMLLYQ